MATTGTNKPSMAQTAATMNKVKEERAKAIKALQLWAMCSQEVPFKPRDSADEAILTGLETRGLLRLTDDGRYERNKYSDMIFDHFVFAGGLK